MTLLLKDPEAALDYAVDWGAEYLNGDELVHSEWAVTPVEESGVAVLASWFDLLVATVKAGGGLPGRVYRLTNRVVLASGREDSRSIMLRVWLSGGRGSSVRARPPSLVRRAALWSMPRRARPSARSSRRSAPMA